MISDLVDEALDAYSSHEDGYVTNGLDHIWWITTGETTLGVACYVWEARVHNRSTVVDPTDPEAFLDALADLAITD